MEDSGAESYLNYGSMSQEVSEEKDISKFPRDNFCDILVENVCFWLLSLMSLNLIEKFWINCDGRVFKTA